MEEEVLQTLKNECDCEYENNNCSRVSKYIIHYCDECLPEQFIKIKDKFEIK